MNNPFNIDEQRRFCRASGLVESQRESLFARGPLVRAASAVPSKTVSGDGASFGPVFARFGLTSNSGELMHFSISVKRVRS